MTPFDLAAALAGKPVVQRNGMAAQIVCKDGDEIVVDLLVLDEDDDFCGNHESEIRTTVDLLGRYNTSLGKTYQDLFMAD